MASPLTAGACQTLYFTEPPPDSATLTPTLQVLSIKKINAQPGAATANVDRYRIILSDGNYFIQSMLATQMNHLVTNKEIDKNSVIKLTGFACNAVQNRRLVILLSVDVVPYSGDKIGQPANIETAKESQQAASAPVAAPAAPAAAAAPPARRAAPAKPRGGASTGPLYPIESLSPYQNKWTIKARVTQRSEIKHWSNQKGEGKLFSVTLMDETGEIRATGFNNVVDDLYEKLAEGKVVFISRARVNIAKKQFSNVQNEYEIMFENHTEVEPCEDDTAVPQVKYAFKRIDELGDVQKDAVIDVIGVVKDVQEVGSIISKASQKPFAKRDITLVDQSCQSVRLTLWGKQAETFDAKDHPVVAFKGVKVGDFGGRSLSMFSSATMTFNPDITEAHGLRGWYDAQGHSATYSAYSSTGPTNSAVKPSEIKTLGQVKDDNLGMQDKPDFFTSQATIAFIKNETFAYPACPTDGCNKKVVETGDAWRCEKCDQNYPNPLYRYILNMNIMDETSNLWVTGFNEIGEQVLGMTADALTHLKEEDEAKALRVFNRACTKQFTLQMMGKPDTYNDTVRVRYSVRRANEIDFASEAVRLAEEIKDFGL